VQPTKIRGQCEFTSAINVTGSNIDSNAGERLLQQPREETVAMVDGKFEAQLALPDSIRGACVITCSLIDNDGILAGSAKIEIKKANR